MVTVAESVVVVAMVTVAESVVVVANSIVVVASEGALVDVCGSGVVVVVLTAVAETVAVSHTSKRRVVVVVGVAR